MKYFYSFVVVAIFALNNFCCADVTIQNNCGNCIFIKPDGHNLIPGFMLVDKFGTLLLPDNAVLFSLSGSRFIKIVRIKNCKNFIALLQIISLVITQRFDISNLATLTIDNPEDGKTYVVNTDGVIIDQDVSTPWQSYGQQNLES